MYDAILDGSNDEISKAFDIINDSLNVLKDISGECLT